MDLEGVNPPTNLPPANNQGHDRNCHNPNNNKNGGSTHEDLHLTVPIKMPTTTLQQMETKSIVSSTNLLFTQGLSAQRTIPIGINSTDHSTLDATQIRETIAPTSLLQSGIQHPG